MLVVQIHCAFASIPGIFPQGNDDGILPALDIAERQAESEYEGVSLQVVGGS